VTANEMVCCPRRSDILRSMGLERGMPNTKLLPAYRSEARRRPGLARLGREDRSRKRFDANSPRHVGP
jgi:hypothetical protein